MTNLRKCTSCGVVNDGENFHKGSPAKDGYQSRCKSCRNSYIVENKKRFPVDKSIASKACKKCFKERGSDKFHSNNSQIDGLSPYCKKCSAKKRKSYYTLEYRASLYNLDINALKNMLEGGCMICGSHERLVIDHDHSCCDKQNYSCGECVRGVLCNRCNIGLAHFADNILKLHNAIKYLNKEDKW